MSRDYNFEDELTLLLNNDLEKYRTFGLTVKNIAKNTYYVLLTNTNKDITDTEYKKIMSEIYVYLNTKKETKTIEAKEGEGSDKVLKNMEQFINVEKI